MTTLIHRINLLDWTTSVFDVVLANINRNVLLREIPVYASLLKAGGQLLVSGFYEQDAVDIERKAVASGLIPVRGMTIRQWTSLVYQKPDDSAALDVAMTTLLLFTPTTA